MYFNQIDEKRRTAIYVRMGSPHISLSYPLINRRKRFRIEYYFTLHLVSE